ncbi:diguanylate cyclase (plasmid) [Rhizobium rosettiformans]|uniref:Diguanylate cyclase n=1 Tax=Rhizobium rosettiformans TaxID=1368430 RepID=A0ABX7F1R2_9HYPH|nr:diguanylate cyclase [Rhizobium rosettiformans]QRF54480.1 diguanylate cyclase [Rhizobium rosettiformans]
MVAQNLLVAFLAQLGVISLTLTLSSLIQDRCRGQLSLLNRAASGILFGGAAFLLMNMPGEFVDGFRFDLRIVPLAVAGLIAGPIGAAVAALTASAARLWIGGAGAGLGLIGIGLAFGVAVFGHYRVKHISNRASDVLVFSLLNAGVALLVLFILPANVRAHLEAENIHLTLLILNFLATLIAAIFIRIDQMRRENAQLNELHKQIVSALPDALNVKDLDGHFLSANEATARLMGGQDSASLVGKTDFDFYKQEEASAFWKQEQEFIANPKPVILEQQFERDGQTVWLSTVKAPFLDEAGQIKAIVSHTTDITSRKLLQAELSATQMLLETAMAEMADGLALFDRDGRLLMWNRRYLEFFPYVDPKTCEGRTLAELLTAGVMRGDIQIPPDVSPMAWVDEEVERSQTAKQSDLKLSDERWVSKSTRALENGGWVTLYADISEKKAAVLQLERLASRDGLTELANRRIFDRQLEKAFEASRISGIPLSLLMFDVDYFKSFNDTYGHPAGDDVLRQVARLLQSGCRSDLDLVARYGGEEFAIILSDCSDDIAHDIAVRLVDAVRKLEIEHVTSPKGRVTISVGLALITDDMPDCLRLLKNCDEALYAAKAAGRDKVRAAPSRSIAVARHHR